MEDHSLEQAVYYNNGQTTTAKDAQEKASSHNSTPEKTSWKVLAAFTSRKASGLLTTAALLSIASGAISPSMAILLGKVFEAFTTFGSETIPDSLFRHQVSQYCIWLSVLGVLSWVLNGSFFAAWLLFGDVQTRACRHTIFNALLAREMSWFDSQSHGIGALLSRSQSHIRELQIAASQPLGYVLHYVSTAIIAIAVALYYSWSLTLLILVAVPITALVLSVLSKRIQSSVSAHLKQRTDAVRVVSIALSSIETIKCCNGQSNESAKYQTAIARAAKYYTQQARNNALQIGLVRCIMLVLFVQGFWFGHHLVFVGKISPGAVITCFWNCLNATQALESVLPHMLVLEQGRAAGTALLKLAKQEQSKFPRLSKKTMKSPMYCRGDIEFKGVYFSYPGRSDHAALQDLSCFFAAGEVTFIIGKSGSGKSTLAQLLLGLYRPVHGEVLIDDVSLESLSRSWLRRNITLVEQTTTVFDGTIYENVALGDRRGNTSVAVVNEAAQFALLLQTIYDMPDGLQTLVGSRGGRLSGGQRQRIALARAKIRDTPILVLDESTSALDHTSQGLVLAAVRKWRQGKTTIFVSHDISQIEDQDYVFILDRGQVTQEGYRRDLDTRAGAPFRKFLPHDQQETFGPEDIFESSSTSSDEVVNVGLDTHQNFRLEDEERLEPLQYRNVPSFFIDRGTRLSFAWSQPLQYTTSMARTSNVTLHNRLKRLQKPEQSYVIRHDRRSKRSSALAADLVQRAGHQAVETRTTTANVRRSYPVMYVPATEQSVSLVDSTTLDLSTFRSIFGTVWSSIRPKFKILLLLGMFSTIIHAVSTPVFSWIFSKLLNTFFDHLHGSSTARTWSLSIIAVAIIDGSACYFMHFFLEQAGQHWVDRIRVKAMERILAQPMQYFDEETNSVATLTHHLDRSADEMRNLLSRFAAFVLVAILMVSISAVWSLTACWKLTLVALAMAPISLAIARSFQAISARMEARSSDAAEDVEDVLTEAIKNIKTVQILTLEQHFQTKFATATESAFKTGVHRALLCGTLFGISEASIVWITALLFYYGSELAASREASIAHVLLVLTMLLFCMANVATIVSFIPQIQSSKDAAKRLLDLSRLPLDSHESRGSLQLQDVSSISFENVTFAHASREDEPALRNITATFSPGISTALVGTSGSGKSTIASLILRLYPISSPNPLASNPVSNSTATRPPSHTTSSLRISGHGINTLSTASVRSRIAFVPQTPVVFPASAAENIAYGIPASSPLRTPASIEAAARAAGIHAFIASLPRGYSTQIGEGGLGLSGGQAQRVAIARALVPRPAVLLLDEPTSALDVESAAVVRDTLTRLVREVGVTVICVTHSREMMQMCQRVVVLEEGRVVEEGEYDELERRKGGKLRSLLRGGVIEDDEYDDTHERRCGRKGKAC